MSGISERVCNFIYYSEFNEIFGLEHKVLQFHLKIWFENDAHKILRFINNFHYKFFILNHKFLSISSKKKILCNTCYLRETLIFRTTYMKFFIGVESN